MSRISVVIAVRDRSVGLQRCLSSLGGLAGDRPIEVIVIDDGSRVPLAEIFSEATWPWPLRIERQIGLGIAAARNLGSELASGELILFVDSDCEVDPFALLELERCAQQCPRAPAFQMQLTSGSHSATQRIEGLRLESILNQTRVDAQRIAYANTSGFAVRRELLKQGPLFNPSFERGEDTEFLARLGTRGDWPVLVERGVIVHNPDLSLPRYVARHYAIGYRTGAARQALARVQHRFLDRGGRIDMFRDMAREARDRNIAHWHLFVVLVAYGLEILGRSTYSLVGMIPRRRRVLAGVVDPLRERELLSRLIGGARRRESLIVTYLNAWSLVAAHRIPAFAALLHRFDLVYADGMGVVLGLLFTRRARSKKVTAADIFFELCTEARDRRRSVALVGAQPGVLRRVLAQIEIRAPGLDVVMARHGYMSSSVRTELADELAEANPHILILGMGQPLQEEFALQLRERMDGTVIWCVGGLFDLLSGDLPAPPAWVRRLGFEWMHRLLTRPRSMWTRYVLGLPYFAWLVLRDLTSRACAFRSGPTNA